MNSQLKDIPRRIFLDSSALQTLQTYGGFLYESEPLSPRDRIYRDPKGVAKLETLRWIMQVAERAPFQFALSMNSLSRFNAEATPAIYSGRMMCSIIGGPVWRNRRNLARMLEHWPPSIRRVSSISVRATGHLSKTRSHWSAMRF